MLTIKTNRNEYSIEATANKMDQFCVLPSIVATYFKTSQQRHFSIGAGIFCYYCEIEITKLIPETAEATDTAEA